MEGWRDGGKEVRRDGGNEEGGREIKPEAERKGRKKIKSPWNLMLINKR